MRTKALYAVLSRKYKDGELLFVDALTFSEPKTKDAKAVIADLAKVKGFEKLATKRVNTALIADVLKSEAVRKSFQNFGNMTVEEVRNLNPVEVLRHKYLIIATPTEAIRQLEARSAAKA
jgi:large subunit ribosomal protein L4